MQQLEADRLDQEIRDEKAAAVKKANEKLERTMLDTEAIERKRIQRDVEVKTLEANRIAKIKEELHERLV